MEVSDLKKKIGQLMVFGFSGTTPSKEIKELIHDYQVGNIILFGRNLTTPQEILSLNTELQSEARKAGQEFPLLICTDQENGIVRRLGEGISEIPGAMLLGATHNPQYAFDAAIATGTEIKALGINWNLAPCVDVNNNPLNPVINVRSFGESPSDVSSFGKAAMKGFKKAGVISVLKHFPGHGDTTTDSHHDLPVISHNMERLEKVELKPFKDCIDEGAEVVMTSHVYFPAIEKREGIPASLSKDVITGLLRGKLGFNGVVTTDCMEMKAIGNGIGTAKGAVEAIKAGIDLVMISHTYSIQKEAIELVMKAVETGEIEEKTINEAYDRVLNLKRKYLSWNNFSEDSKITVPSVVGCQEHKDKAMEIYKHGVTIVKNEGVLPLSKDEEILVIYPDSVVYFGVEDFKHSKNTLGGVVQEICTKSRVMTISNPAKPFEVEKVLEIVQKYQTIIVGTLSLREKNPQTELIKKLIELKKKLVVIAMRSPYDLLNFTEVPAYVATFEYTHSALKVALNAIFGVDKVSGKLPVAVLDH